MRESKHLSLAALADKAGVTVGVIQGAEKGDTMPTLANFCAWAGALGVDVVLSSRDDSGKAA